MYVAYLSKWKKGMLYCANQLSIKQCMCDVKKIASYFTRDAGIVIEVEVEASWCPWAPNSGATLLCKMFCKTVQLTARIADLLPHSFELSPEGNSNTFVVFPPNLSTTSNFSVSVQRSCCLRQFYHYVPFAKLFRLQISLPRLWRYDHRLVPSLRRIGRKMSAQEYKSLWCSIWRLILNRVTMMTLRINVVIHAKFGFMLSLS